MLEAMDYLGAIGGLLSGSSAAGAIGGVLGSRGRGAHHQLMATPGAMKSAIEQLREQDVARYMARAVAGVPRPQPGDILLSVKHLSLDEQLHYDALDDWDREFQERTGLFPPFSRLMVLGRDAY